MSRASPTDPHDQSSRQYPLSHDHGCLLILHLRSPWSVSLNRGSLRTLTNSKAECIYKKKWLPPSIATGKTSRPSSQATYTNGIVSSRPALSADDDAKLIFGTVFSLRNMVRKLGGEDDRYKSTTPGRHAADLSSSFLSYRTSQYKLHYYETPTNTKFVMLTDIKSGSMRIALQQIYVNCYVEYVVKNPLSPTEHPGGLGVNNELFEASLGQFVVSMYPIQRTR